MSITGSVQIQLDSPPSDFNLPATDGKNYSLDSFKEAHGLVIVFTCNHCPYAKAAWPLLIQQSVEFRPKGVEFVAINPNDESEYPEDSFQVMKEKIAEWGINFPYLRDESQEIAKKYQAVCTPDIFAYGEDRKLFYHGRINNNWQDPNKVTSDDLRDALNSMLAGKYPPTNQQPSRGCSI
ncbi:thioredoxin family protein, partial [Patescibacteria group bacterium]|nr:thioredoxin family protein [Patescibacteria group bacterium]